MNVSATLLDLAGCTALLLWGTHMVQSGIQRAFGPKLRSTLGKALSGRLQAFAAGVGVTALLQSSTATGLMTAGFAAAGFVDLVPALAVMLGANVGTALIVQVLSFDVAAISPALIVLGVVLFRKAQVSTVRDVGRAFIGGGLMLLALHQLVGALAPYEDTPNLRLILGAVASAPLIAMLLAAVATWLAHSSVAIILIVVSMAGRGIVAPDAAFAMVLGANLGTSLNPLLEGVRTDDPSAKRLPMGNLIIRAVVACGALAALSPLGRWMTLAVADVAGSVAAFHVLFNLTIAVVALPALGPYARLLKRLYPTRVDDADPSRPLYLDPHAQETPLVALGAAAREALRMSDVLDAMLQNVEDAFRSDDRKPIAEAKRLDDTLDRLNAAIRAYLAALDPESMSDDDQRRMAEILAFSTNLEHAGDVVDRNLLPIAQRRIKRNLAFSREGLEELMTMLARVRANLGRAASLFMIGDVRLARLLTAEKAVFRDLEAAATKGHFARLRQAPADAAETSALHIDALRDLQRINSHLIAGSAYPVLERDGGLLPSRLVGPDL